MCVTPASYPAGCVLEKKLRLRGRDLTKVTNRDTDLAQGQGGPSGESPVLADLASETSGLVL